jgi:carbamoyltransferase
MGMAPYASRSASQKIADELRSFFTVSDDGLTWKFNKGRAIFESAHFWREYIHLKRFDHVMGGLQIFIEEFLVDWVKAAIKKTGIRKVAFAGGTFMNVKANKRIMELPEVESIFVFPSCGDESSSIGVCWYAQHEKYLSEFSLTDVYWGIALDNDAIKKSFEAYPFTKKYKIGYVDDIETTVASLLASHNIVGRFAGREEFGARSLGNRALIANPSKPEVIKEINEMIKSRDFWMPFASSILDRRRGDYLLEMGKNDPLYMIMTFDSLPGANEIVAGIHPYDRTVRPQVVTPRSNARYHALIDAFEKQTGIGGVLNTSLNLHGLPLVHTPEDAFLLLEKSSLKFLAIENYLIEKIG